MRRTAVWAAIVVFVLAGLFVVRPFMAFERDQPASIPSPASLERTDTVPLAPGAPACFRYAAIEHHSEIARFKVSSPKGPAPAMRVSLKGPGYAYAGEVPAGIPDTGQAQLAVPAAPTDLPVRVCISNLGRQPIALFASSDRTTSRSKAHIHGKSTGKSIWFGFFEARPKAITERLPVTLERMTIFRPGYVGRGLLWALLVLFCAGMPVGIVWAYVRALREDEPPGGRAFDVNRRRSLWRRIVG